MKILKVLIACEESQVVCKAFRELGHEAFSNDVIECSGGYPEWHLKMDCFEAIKLKEWDLMIAHPPCTYLSRAGSRWLYPKGILCKERYMLGLIAKDFFIKLLNSNINHICVENPTQSKIYEMPLHSQVIQPYMFGDAYSKKTLLWLKNIPPLIPTNILSEYKPYLSSKTGGKKRGEKYWIGTATTKKQRSKTFQGIAEAMAKQWSEFIIHEK